MNERVCVYVCGYATYSLCPHMAERARGLFGVSFYKSITPVSASVFTQPLPPGSMCLQLCIGTPVTIQGPP